MSFWTLYFLSRLDGIKDVINIISVPLWLLFVVIGGGIIICVFIKNFYKDSEYASGKETANITTGLINSFGPWLKKVTTALILLLILNVFIPTFKEAIVFVGIDYITTNENIQETAADSFKLFSNYVDEKLATIEAVKETVEK